MTLAAGCGRLQTSTAGGDPSLLKLIFIAALALAAAAPAAAQQQPQAQLRHLRLEALRDKPDCYQAEMSEAFGSPAAEASQRIAEMEKEDPTGWSFGGLRAALDEAGRHAATATERLVLAEMELWLAVGAHDGSRLMAVWEPVLASGCYPDEQVTAFRTELAGVVRRYPGVQP